MAGKEYLKNAGIVPHRTTDPREAFMFWCIDGACILLTGRTDPDALINGVQGIFGTHLPPQWPESIPGAVATNSDPTQQGFDFTTRTLLSDAHNRLEAHNDGAVGYGDVYPDLLTLLCAQPATSGGQSFLVDGQYLLDAIARDTTARDLAQFLWSVPIEQSAREEDRPPGTPHYVPSRRPIASLTAGGRLTVRYNREHQRLLDDEPVDEQHRAQLAHWHHLGQLAAAAAPRFLLKPGELLVVNNYRVFHGREPYQGTDRYLHRAQAFTDTSFRALTHEPMHAP
jgi:alpha-ketoglutarate-dependent taurine dioxygenase